MSISAASGSKLYIGSAGESENLSQFLADAFVEVGELEDLGEFGDESEQVTFASLSDGRIRKLKGTRDAGTMPVTVGSDMTDTGQIAMEDAEASPLNFQFKVVLNDQLTISGDPSEHYFFGKVMSKRVNVGTANNVVRRAFSVDIDSAIISVDPT